MPRSGTLTVINLASRKMGEETMRGVFVFRRGWLRKSFLKRELRFRMQLGESMTEQDCGRDDDEHLCGEQLPRRKDRGAEQEKNEHQDD